MPKSLACRLWESSFYLSHGLVPKKDGLGKRNFTVIVTQLKTEFTCSKSLSGKTSFYKIDMMVGERKNSLSQGLGRNLFFRFNLFLLVPAFHRPWRIFGVLFT